MRLSTLAIASAAAAGVAVALPAVKRSVEPSITDTTILQYALTLEHLENFFYHDALDKFDAQAFTDAGFPNWVRGRIEQIAAHESTHVEFLAGALGKDAVTPCNYTFPYTDPKSFVALATLIENVGTSAYLGAASYIQDKAYVTAAGAILTTEARHQSWLSSSVQNNEPWSGAFDTPLDFSDVYSIAAGFIVGCPASNAALPFTAFPSLTLDITNGDPSGQNISLVYGDQCPAKMTKRAEEKRGDMTATAESCLIVYSGLNVLALPIGNDCTAEFPNGFQGISYAVVSSSCNTSMVDYTNTIAGPAIIDVPFSSLVKNPMFTGM